MTRVAVFGGTGMVGTPAVAQLRADGHEVVVAVRGQDAARAKLPAGVQSVRADTSDPSTLRAVVDGADAVIVIHPLSIEPEGAFNAEVDGTRNIVSAIAGSSTRLVKLSEIGASSDPEFRDLEAKGKAKEIIRASGLPYVILRPTWFMEGWKAQLRAGPDFLSIGEGTRSIHWIALTDMARWLSQATTSQRALNKTLTVQGRDALTMQDAATLLAEASGANVVRMPVDGIRPPGAPAGLIRTLHELFRYYDRTPEAFEAKEAWSILGEPTVRFADFVEEVSAVHSQ